MVLMVSSMTDSPEKKKGKKHIFGLSKKNLKKNKMNKKSILYNSKE
jgi:hypothetical protein